MSYEGYEFSYYADKLTEAQKIVEAAIGYKDAKKTLYDAICVQAVFSKVARDAYYLKEEYERSKLGVVTREDAEKAIKQEKQDKEPKQKITYELVENVLGKKDAAQVVVTVDRTKDIIDIAPKSWLGKQLFIQVNEKLKRLGAVYVSAGKDSRWTIQN